MEDLETDARAFGWAVRSVPCKSQGDHQSRWIYTKQSSDGYTGDEMCLKGKKRVAEKAVQSHGRDSAVAGCSAFAV